MSTIKTTNIGHPSAGSDAITLAADGSTTFNGPVSGAGLDHIVTETFTAQSAVSVDSVFSAEYDNYLVLVDGTRSESSFMAIRMRISGSDISTGTYNRQYLRVSGTTVSGGASASETSSRLTSADAATRAVYDVMLYAPAKSETTFINALGRAISASYISYTTHTQTDSTAFDGFTLFASSGTLTGSLSVYGYKS